MWNSEFSTFYMYFYIFEDGLFYYETIFMVWGYVWLIQGPLSIGKISRRSRAASTSRSGLSTAKRGSEKKKVITLWV